MLPSLVFSGLGFSVWRQIQLRFRRASSYQPRQYLAARLAPVGEGTGGFGCFPCLVESQDF
jgi:hypothetical protein